METENTFIKTVINMKGSGVMDSFTVMVYLDGLMVISMMVNIKMEKKMVKESLNWEKKYILEIG